VSRRAEAVSPERQMERENRYDQKPPVGQSAGVVSVFPAEADEVAAATRCTTRYAVDAADRADLLEALGLVETQAPKAHTRNGKTTFGRGTCPFCLRSMQVGVTGLMLSHRRQGKRSGVTCPGVGEQPKAPVADDPGAGKTAMEVPA
jgi:hypothetical protein